MAETTKRDNEYWRARLGKDGHADLLARVEADEISVYKAAQIAGYRAKGPRSVSGKLSYHWKRASADERKRFVKHHLIEINRVGREALAEVRAEEAKKPAE
ncbi:hypothetical protein [Croceicoccus ponticola]|nr:hypothetical protein [Croceicoccus ponticola]